MGSFSKYLEEQLLNHVVGPSAYLKPASLYLALFTTRTDDEDGGTEVKGNGYRRERITFAPAEEGAGRIANRNVVPFSIATPKGWGTVSDFGIYDAQTGGNRLVYGPLAVPKSIGAGDRMEFGAGALVVSLD